MKNNLSKKYGPPTKIFFALLTFAFLYADSKALMMEIWLADSPEKQEQIIRSAESKTENWVNGIEGGERWQNLPLEEKKMRMFFLNDLNMNVNFLSYALHSGFEHFEKTKNIIHRKLI